jgi:hypothetical protein
MRRSRRTVVVWSAVTTLALIGTAYWLWCPGAVERLQPCLNQDLRELREDEQVRFDRLITRLAPEAKTFVLPAHPQTWDLKEWFDYFQTRPFPFFQLQSWYLWRVTTGEGRDRLILFQGEPLWSIPGSSSARIFVFDTDGKLLNQCKFSTGWRITIEDARWVEDSDHGFPCVLVDSAPSINGGDITRQYFAFLDDRFALVRLEDSSGQFVPVFYHAPNHTIGPAVPVRTPEQWEAALRSLDRAEVLRTLVWLGGDHSDPPIVDAKNICVEPFDEAALALETRARPGVRSAVEALTRSEDRWVREAAQQARQAIQGGKR